MYCSCSGISNYNYGYTIYGKLGQSVFIDWIHEILDNVWSKLSTDQVIEYLFIIMILATNELVVTKSKKITVDNHGELMSIIL